MSTSDCLIFFAPFMATCLILAGLTAWLDWHDWQRLSRVNGGRS
jgi:hypothetical protein